MNFRVVLLLSLYLASCASMADTAQDREALSIIQAELVKAQAFKSGLLQAPKTDDFAAKLHRIESDIDSLSREVSNWTKRIQGAAKQVAGAKLPEVSSSQYNQGGGSRIRSRSSSSQVALAKGNYVDGIPVKTAGIWEAQP